MLTIQDYGFLTTAVGNIQIKGSDAPYVAEVLIKLQKLVDKEQKKIEKNKK